MFGETQLVGVAAHHGGIPAILEVNCLFTADQYHRFEPLSFERLAARLEWRALTLADAVLAVSTPLARAIDSMAPVRSFLLPNGADPDRFDPARAHAEEARTKHRLRAGLTVGWAGVIREWHGLELLLDALVALPALQLLAVALNFAVVVVQSRPAFTLPFKSLDDMLAMNPFATLPRTRVERNGAVIGMATPRDMSRVAS